MPHVQFADSAETKIIAVFSCTQDAATYPNQAEIEATDARYVAFLNPSQLQAQAQAQLGKNDITALRCVKKKVSYPDEWLAFDEALRAIINSTDTASTVLPTAPTKADGTIDYPA